MFFEHGVYRQQKSLTICEANRNYSYSCELCCNRGYRVDCDRCPIKFAHKQTVELLRSLAKSRILA